MIIYEVYGQTHSFHRGWSTNEHQVYLPTKKQAIKLVRKLRQEAKLSWQRHVDNGGLDPLPRDTLEIVTHKIGSGKAAVCDFLSSLFNC